jgi:fermentation-respiration switch protein FrsA (DUF1100 family)
MLFSFLEHRKYVIILLIYGGNNMDVFIIIGIILCVTIVIMYYIVKHYLNLVVTRPVKDCEILYEKECARGLIDKVFYEGLKKEEVFLVTKDGLKLKGIYIEGDRSLGKTMVFVHGITVGTATSIKYTKMFIDRGYSILMYDQRRHGESEGKYSTFGYLEKQDLDLWIEWLIKRNGENEIIGLHGESMGAATVLQYAEVNKYVKFIIADCGYSDMNELMKFRMKEDTKYPTFPLINLASLRAKRIAKFSFSDVSPIEAIRNSDIPILFIHGKEDKFVPTFMSEKMCQAKNKGISKLYITEGAAHAESFAVDREKYEQVVLEFINETIRKKIY